MSLTLTPTNVASITAAAVQFLLADSSLNDVTVERSEEINTEPARCPWVGVYRTGIQYPSRALGFGPGMRDQQIQLLFLCQAQNAKGGAECEDELEDLVQRVLRALLSDTTLGGVVRTLDEVNIQYPNYEKTASGFYMQTAALYITAIGGIQ